MSLDSDDSGRRLLLALIDGSVWRVEADGSAAMLTAPQCRNAWKEIAPGTKTFDYGPCKHAQVQLSRSGRTGVVQRAEVVTGYDFDAATSKTIDDSRLCDTAHDKARCQIEALRVIDFRGDDVLLRRRGKRTTMWFLSEGGVARDVPVPMDNAVSGPNSSFTGYSSQGYSVTQIIPAIRQTLVAGMTFNLGGCDAIPRVTLSTLARSLGCRSPPSQYRLRIPIWRSRQPRGDIHIKRLTGNSRFDIPDLRKIKLACQPHQEKMFNSLSLDKPSGCKVTAMRFGPSGATLAALSEDDRLRVFRVNNGPMPRRRRTARTGGAAVRCAVLRLRRQGGDVDRGPRNRRHSQVRSDRTLPRKDVDFGGLRPDPTSTVRTRGIARYDLRPAAQSSKPAYRTQRHRRYGNPVPFSGATTGRDRQATLRPTLTRRTLRNAPNPKQLKADSDFQPFVSETSFGLNWWLTRL